MYGSEEKVIRVIRRITNLEELMEKMIEERGERWDEITLFIMNVISTIKDRQERIGADA